MRHVDGDRLWGPALEVGVLGPFEMAVHGRPVALSAGRVVPVERLAEGVWADALPGNVRRSVQTYMARLRCTLGPELIGTTPAGYVLYADPGHVDALRFGRLVEAAAAAPGIAEERALLSEALRLWRGRPFAGVPSEWLDASETPRLLERYLAAVERRLDLDLAAGRHRECVAELAELTARHPLRESLWTRLLVALDRCGRHAEALSRYETVRRLIAGELGVDPGPELRRLHTDLLTGGPVEVGATLSGIRA
ncbi:MAG: hypothetical protein GEV11_29825 [Streptosporangiales bacterium]|nr:hypothetical protein [Streptosporangiales bacterium]